MLLNKIGNIQSPGSQTSAPIENRTLSENAIISAGNIPKINVNEIIMKVGKNTNQDSR